MAHFIDRRKNTKGKSTVNRQRFIRRYKSQLKKAVSDSVGNRSVEDTETGEKVSIPSKDIQEPSFHHGRGGHRHRVLPGNDQFVPGDKIPRPPSGSGGGSGKGDASNSGSDQDDFVFEISRDEYLDLLFDDLELPNLQRKSTEQIIEWENRRAGFTTDGVPANIDVVRSLQGSVARRIAMTSSKRRQLQLKEQQLLELRQEHEDASPEAKNLRLEIEELKQRIQAVPFIDSYDLKYRNYSRYPIPSSRAVMFCLMDVSGSMDQATKDMAKRFYILLYLFLTRNYEHIEVVYIRHHTQAKEVDEHEFFYSQETGGTIVSSALNLMADIVDKRYDPNVWNIYAAQASDGDNWADDSPHCSELLKKRILPKVRYYAYIEITQRSHQSLWREYTRIMAADPHFAMQHIRSVADIFPVFRELFKKKLAA